MARGKLTPPLMRIPNMTPRSWMNERVPEMVWAALLIERLGRQGALEVFRRLVMVVQQHRAAIGTKGRFDLTISEIALLPEQMAESVVRVLTSSLAQREALSCLLLFDGLPARERWQSAIGDLPKGDWELLARAVARVLDHQSEEATDCRWVRVIGKMALGQMFFPPCMRDTVSGIIGYPNVGDLRVIRPTIRATEGTFSGLMNEMPKTDPTPWVSEFWMKSLELTPCIRLEGAVPKFEVGTTREAISRTRARVVDLCNSTRVTSGVDPRHEASFGLGLFSLAILDELTRIGVSSSILGRAGLRMLLETFITFTYLAQKDDRQVWEKYRRYGAGQAKLTFLKLDEMENPPGFVSRETLHALANEDAWQEFVEVDLGHWAGEDLRRMSAATGTKDAYDSYFGWTSAFVHANWGAIRNVAFENCMNPLHRLHRIASPESRGLDDVLEDACNLVDRVLSILSRLYGDGNQISLSGHTPPN